MDSIIDLLLLILIFCPPFFITLIYLIKSLFNFPSLAIWRLILITLLTGVWIFFGFPWLLNVQWLSDDNIILISHIGAISGIISRIMLASIFAKPALGRMTHRLANISMISSAMLLGMRLEQYVLNNAKFYGIEKNGEWTEVYHPLTRMIIVTSTVTLVTAFIMGIRLQNALPEEIIDDNLKFLNNAMIVLFSLGAFFSILAIVVLIPVFPNLLVFNYIMSRFFISLAFLILARYISFDPIFVFQEQGNLKRLLDEGIIGWIISLNGDLGPDAIAESPKMIEKYSITPNESVSFSASAITAIGLTHTFGKSTFVIPFSGLQKLSSINFSFYHFDPTLKDPRFQHSALTVYSIIFPVIILPRIRTFLKAEEILNKRVKEFETIHDLLDTDILDDITNEILKVIIA